jgi:hypothetical protein
LDELKAVEESIANNLFKENKTITLEKLVKLREKMYKEIYTFEFNNFEHNEKGNISGEDFAKSLISYLQPSLVGKYWRELNEVEWKVIHIVLFKISG